MFATCLHSLCSPLNIPSDIWHHFSCRTKAWATFLSDYSLWLRNLFLRTSLFHCLNFHSVGLVSRGVMSGGCCVKKSKRRTRFWFWYQSQILKRDISEWNWLHTEQTNMLSWQSQLFNNKTIIIHIFLYSSIIYI